MIFHILKDRHAYREEVLHATDDSTTNWVSTMKKMRELFVSIPTNQHIIELRCFAHAINLMTGKNFV